MLSVLIGMSIVLLFVVIFKRGIATIFIQAQTNLATFLNSLPFPILIAICLMVIVLLLMAMCYLDSPAKKDNAVETHENNDEF